ncbi:MAG: class I SAM-dependent methyltransferase [Candidatus Kariarchaeaceae archaeon]
MNNEEKKIVSEGYDKMAEKYLAFRNSEQDECELLPEFIEKVQALTSNGKVLDAGCGSGIPYTDKLSQYFDVIGIDISEKQISIAKRLVPKAKFFAKDMLNLDFPDEFFDGIISYYAIIHVPREEHFEILTNFNRMLKKGGLMLLGMSSLDDPGTSYDDFFGETMYWSSFDTETNLKLIKESGFELLWMKKIEDSLSDNYHPFFLVRKK